MDQIDKLKINENLNKYPILMGLVTKGWINKELEENKPSTLIWIIKYEEPLLQQLENNLNCIGSDEVNQHKAHVLGLLKSKEAENVYGIISEIEIWAHLKRNDICFRYQQQINSLNPDFVIKLNQEEIIIEIVAIAEEENVKNKFYRELSKQENNGTFHFVVNEVEKHSDCYRLYSALDKKINKFKNNSKNVIIINTLFASGGGLWSLKNAIEGYYKLEKNGHEVGYIKYKGENGVEKDMPSFFAQKDINREVNAVVGYHGCINNTSIYFHDNPYIPFTTEEERELAKIFSNKISEEGIKCIPIKH